MTRTMIAVAAGFILVAASDAALAHGSSGNKNFSMHSDRSGHCGNRDHAHRRDRDNPITITFGGNPPRSPVTPPPTGVIYF